MKILNADLRYVLCPGSLPHPSFVEDYNKIYKCWWEVWDETFKELRTTDDLKSDNFTRQDYIGAIYCNDVCVALSFFRWTDARRAEFSTDSYFDNWSKDHLQVLTSRGPKIIVCSQFTVHQVARGKKMGFSTKDLLMGMIVETFMNSKADGMTGAVRVDRGVSNAGERWGAAVIEKSVPCEFGEDNTELIGFFKDHISKQNLPELRTVAEQLWNDRLVIPRAHLDYEFSNKVILKNMAA